MQTTHRKYKRSLNAVRTEVILLKTKVPIAGPASKALLAAFFTTVIVIASLVSLAQTAGSFPSDLSLPEVVFNKKFIKENKIKLIRARVVDKPDGEIIRDKGLAENFMFDTDGNLVKHYYNEISALQKTETEVAPVYSKHGKVVKKSYTKVNYEYKYDTLGTEFFYTSNGFLQMQRVCIGDFYNTTYYEYFGDGLVSRQTKCKETNIAKKGEPFKLGTQIVRSDEKWEYEVLSPTQVKKKFLNDEGKPYKQGILNYLPATTAGTEKKLVDENYQFVAGFVRSGVSYKYDASGRLIEKLAYDNSSGNNQDKTTYEYDGKGNTIKEKRFRNGIQTNEIIFLYEANPTFLGNNQVGTLLTSQADRQIEKESIKIVKYEYEFY